MATFICEAFNKKTKEYLFKSDHLEPGLEDPNPKNKFFSASGPVACFYFCMFKFMYNLIHKVLFGLVNCLSTKNTLI